MSSESLENQLRGYNAVLGALGVLALDICGDCLMMKGAKIRLSKGLKKLEADITEAVLPADTREQVVLQVKRFAGVVEGLSQAAEYT